MIKYPPDSNNTESFKKNERRYIDMFNEVLYDIEFTQSEEEFLHWMAGWDDWTIKNFISVISKAKR